MKCRKEKYKEKWMCRSSSTAIYLSIFSLHFSHWMLFIYSSWFSFFYPVVAVSEVSSTVIIMLLLVLSWGGWCSATIRGWYSLYPILLFPFVLCLCAPKAYRLVELVFVSMDLCSHCIPNSRIGPKIYPPTYIYTFISKNITESKVGNSL